MRSNLPSGRGCCSMQVWEICNQPMSRQCDANFTRCWFIFIFCWLCIVETSFVFIYARCLLYLAGARLELQADAMDFHFCKSGIAMRAPSVELVAKCCEYVGCHFCFSNHNIINRYLRLCRRALCKLGHVDKNVGPAKKSIGRQGPRWYLSLMLSALKFCGFHGI